MRIIKLPVGETSPRAGITRIMTEAKNALRKFCQSKVIELKLAPSSFNFVFDFHDSRRSAKKSIDRISAMLKRKVVKRMPFLEFTEGGGAIRSAAGGSGMYITIRLPETKSDRRFGSTPRNLEASGEKYKRYARMINYLCRKHGAPFCAIVTNTYEVSKQESDRISALSADQVSNETNFPMYIPIVEFRFNLAIWALTQEPGFTTGEFRDKFLSGEDLDEVFANSDYWTNNPVLEARSISEHMDGATPLENLYTPERAFLFIPQAVQALSTLSKESTYDFRAFSFRAAEMSSDQPGVQSSTAEVQPTPQPGQ